MLTLSLILINLYFLKFSIAENTCIIGYICGNNATINSKCVHQMGILGMSEGGQSMCIPNNKKGKNVFGKDDRVQVTSTKFPWSAIGYLNTACTGSLVGRDLVLTAAHCVIDSKTQKLNNINTFYPNRINGQSPDSSSISYIWWGTSNPDKYREKDWALLRLSKALGDKFGYFGIKSLNENEMLASVATQVGYSENFQNGKTAGAHIGCRIIKKTSNNLYLHNCDAGRGSSGGPIFSWWNNLPYIFALNVAEYRNGGSQTLILPDYTEDNANIAIWSAELANKILELKTS